MIWINRTKAAGAADPAGQMDSHFPQAHIFSARPLSRPCEIGGGSMGNRFATGSMVGAVVAAIATAFLTLHHGILIGVAGGVAIAVAVAVLVSLVAKRGDPPPP
jgi:hypothetical protein